MIGVGTLIWVSLRPLLRLFLTVGCGFAITKADLFPTIAASGVGQIILNITLPTLMFSKIVPAFNSSNISALGPLVIVAILYEVIGMLMAWIILQFCWVPHRFRNGMLVAGGWGNYGDIPTSVIMSITGAAPFNGTVDQDLAVAYIAAFILIFFITLFPLGGHKLIALDYAGTNIEDDEVRERMRIKRRQLMTSWKWIVFRSGKRLIEPSPFSEEKGDPGCNDRTVYNAHPQARSSDQSLHVAFSTNDAVATFPSEYGNTSIDRSPTPTDALASRLTSSAPTVIPDDEPSAAGIKEIAQDTTLSLSGNAISASNSLPQRQSHRHRFRTHVLDFLRSLMSPSSITIIVAFIISVVPDLQALFVPGVPGTNIPNAPDGQPPLAFVMDTTSFIGAASVPLGLISLGSALARLKVPRDRWRSLPLGAIISLAVGKMLIMPVLGVLICQGLTHVGIIEKSNNVLRYVCIFFACLPTATTQVFLTQVYSGSGTAEHLSPFLIPQYILMFISMTALTAYTLILLFP